MSNSVSSSVSSSRKSGGPPLVAAHKPDRRLVLLAGVAGLVLLMHWQLLLHLPTHFVGRPFEDAVEVIWAFDWAGQALRDGTLWRLYTPQIFYPHGFYLAADEFIWWPALLSPLTALLGPVTTYNLTILAALVGGGWGMALLVHHLTGRTAAGLVAAAVYVAAPVLAMRVNGHLNILIGAMWLPYGLLWAHIALERTQAGRGHAWRAACWAGLFYALSSLGSWYFVFITAVPWLMVFLLDRREVRPLQRLQLLAIALVTWFLLVLPFLLLTFRANARMFTAQPAFSLAESDALSMSPDALLMPSPLHALWGPAVARLFAIQGEHAMVGLGYTALLLALVGFWFRPARGRRWTYLTIFGAALVLAMGTTLHLGGARVLLPLSAAWAERYSSWVGGLLAPITTEPAVPLPSLVLAELVPLFAGMRAWSRFIIGGVLAVAVLAGMGSAYLWSRGRTGRLLAGAALILVVVEGWATPYPSLTPVAELTRSADEWLARQPPGAVMEYPLYLRKLAHFNQAQHGQSLVVGAMLAHFPSSLQEQPQVLTNWPTPEGLALLRTWDVDYGIVTVTNARSRELVREMADWPDICLVYQGRGRRAVAGEEGAYIFALRVPEQGCPPVIVEQ